MLHPQWLSAARSLSADAGMGFFAFSAVLRRCGNTVECYKSCDMETLFPGRMRIPICNPFHRSTFLSVEGKENSSEIKFILLQGMLWDELSGNK